MNKEKKKINPAQKLFKSIEKFLKAPQLPDPNQTRTAKIIHALALIILPIGVGVISISWLFTTNPIYGITIALSDVIVILLVMYFNHQGRTKLASHLFVYSFWIIDTIILVASGGFSSAYLSTYITITVLGGFILGGFSAFHLAGISVISSLVLYFLGTQGFMPVPIIVFKPIASYFISSVNTVLAATVLVMVLSKYEKTFKQLLDNEQSLSKTNLELTREIQARKEAELLQQQSENRFESVLMDSPIPTMLHAEDGEIILINKAWIEKSGYSPQDLDTAEQWINHSFRENASLINDEIQQLFQSKTNQKEGYYKVNTRLGEIRDWYLHWVCLPELSDGKKMILTMATDMTELMDVESALRESEEIISKLALVTNDGIWDWNLRSESVVFDPLYYTMAGYEVNEFPHHLVEFRKRIHPDDVERVFKLAEDYITGIQNKFIAEFRFLNKDGSWLWVLGRGNIIEQDENGNPLRFVGTHTDISALKSVEEELNRYQDKLEDIVEDRTQKLNERISEVERLNAALTNILDDYQIANEKLSSMSRSLTDTYQELESFTYSVSNDLREPLKAVKQSSDTLMKKYHAKLDPKAKIYLEEVQLNTALMDQLIENLLKLAELGRKEITPVPVNPTTLVNKVIKSYAEEIEDRKIKTNIKELPPCMADENLLEMVFQSLIGNAVKFTKKQKNAEITIGHQPGQTSERVIYYVKDNGVGFNSKDQENIYDTFHRLHSQEEFQGIGIGLTLAKKIINRHGGEIWAEAVENEGATFYFALNRPAD